eukprot:1161174-Pelagomonas_calceolata.AAC.1
MEEVTRRIQRIQGDCMQVKARRPMRGSHGNRAYVCTSGLMHASHGDMAFACKSRQGGSKEAYARQSEQWGLCVHIRADACKSWRRGFCMQVKARRQQGGLCKAAMAMGLMCAHQG